MSDDTRLSPSQEQARLIEAALRQIAAIPQPEQGSVAARLAAAARFAPRLAPDAFPGYAIVDEIHRGGQGVVYRAHQASTQREVAIKVLRDSHLQTGSDVARFELEVRVLARLRHPNIVRVFDSQVVDGHFYYAMDYIAGAPLDQFMLACKPPLVDLVRVFVKICDAVNFAHLHGIIHRDLKPGNIRVDSAGEPYLLDFGLSKLIGDVPQDFTMTGQFVGSMPWASPEQVNGSVAGVDLRTDVYSLGVLLYQMLTWKFPYAVTGAPSEVLRQIVEVEPPPLRKSIPSLPADLETIVLKCLQKAPERRYQSAGDLARDLQRFCEGEPIAARRDSIAYILRKQLARYRYAAIGSTLLVVALAAAFVTSITFWRQAEQARETEARLRVAAMRSAEETQRQAGVAAHESAKAAAVADFLTEMLTSVNPYAGGELNIRVVDTLETAIKRLDNGALRDLPEREGTIRRVLGIAYAALGHVAPAEQQLRAAVERLSAAGGSDSAAIEASIDLGGLLAAVPRHEESERTLRAALDAARRNLGGRHQLVASALEELGSLLRDLGRLDESEASLRDALAIRQETQGDRDPAALDTLNNLALTLDAAGRPDEAYALLQRAVSASREIRGPRHPSVGSMINNLASLLAARADYTAAESHFQEGLSIARASFGSRHPTVAQYLQNLGALYLRQQRYAEALPLFEEALEMNRDLLGERHPSVAIALNNVATIAQPLGRYDLAAARLTEAAGIFEEVYGPDHENVLVVRLNLAAVLFKRGEFNSAEAAIRAVHAAYVARFGPDHPKSVDSLGSLAVVLTEQERLTEAAAALESVIAIETQRFGRHNPNVAQWIDKLAYVRGQQGEFAEAEALTREALASLLAADRRNDVARALTQLSDIAYRQDCLDEALFLLGRAIEICAEFLGPDHPDLGQRRIRYGLMCHRVGSTDDALSEIRQGLAAIETTLGNADQRVVQGRKELSRLLREVGQSEEADAWRALLAEP